MDIEKTQNFGDNLKLLRKQMGLTQQGIADKINTSRSCISNYESGNRQPDNETIKVLADFFDVSVDYLFGRSNVRGIAKNNEKVIKMEKFLSRAESFDTLDLSDASAYIKCAVVEFYAYLLKKERRNKE